MASITVSSEAGVLQRQYAQDLIEMENLEIGIRKRFPRLKDYRTTGAGHYFGTRMRTNQKMGAAADGGVIVTPGISTFVQGVLTCVYNYRPYQTTGPAIARTLKGGGFISDVLTDDIMLGQDELWKDLNRQAVRNGDAILTQANGAGTTSAALICDSVRHIRPNMVVESYSSGAVAGITNQTVSKVNFKTKTVTLAGNESWLDNDNIYRYPQYSTGVGALETQGLQQMIDDDTTASFEGIDPDTYGEWTSYVDDDGGNITRQRFFKATEFTRTLSGSRVDECWMNPSMRDKLFMLVQPGVNFTGPKNLEIAYSPEDDPLTFQGLTFPVDDDIFDGDIFGINWDSLGRIVEKELGIDSIIPGLSTTLLRDAGYDKATGFISVYDQLAILNRRANFKFSGATTDYSI